MTRLLRLCLLAMLLLVSAACRQEQKPAASDVALNMTVSDLLVGNTTLTVRVSDKQGNPLAEPGALSLRGDMDHAGMIPVLAKADTAVEGVFTVPFEWTMSGSWIVEASLQLSADEIVRQEFRFEIASPSDNVDTAGADHGAMTRMEITDMSGGNSAAYMRIANRGSEDIALVSAASTAAEAIEFHETRVTDGLASMERLDEIVVPGSGEIELAPGGLHLMLMSLPADLRLNDNFVLELTDSAGQLYSVNIPISEPPSNDSMDAVYLGDLIFSRQWARPASAG